MFDILFQPAPDGQLYIQWLITGLGWTLLLAFFGWWIAFALGVVVGVGRTLPSRLLSSLARTYVELFRNVPLLVQMFLWYFVMPEIVPQALGDAIKQMPPPWGAFWPALLCLSLSPPHALQNRSKPVSKPCPAARSKPLRRLV